MAVIPGQGLPDGKPTEDTNYASDVKALQLVTEDTPKNAARGSLAPWQEGRDNFLTNIIGGIGSAIIGGITGIVDGISSIFQPVTRAGEEIRDGQLDLINRQDTLDKLMNRGGAYPSYSEWADARTWYRVPFDSQIGPARQTVVGGGRVKLLEAGHWDVYAQIITANAAGLLVRSIDWEVRAYVPTSSGGRRLHAKQNGRLNGNPSQQGTIVTDFGFDVAGAEIEVWVYVHNYYGRNIAWGPANCRLTCKQVSSDRIGGDGSEDSGIPEVNS